MNAACPSGPRTPTENAGTLHDMHLDKWISVMSFPGRLRGWRSRLSRVWWRVSRRHYHAWCNELQNALQAASVDFSAQEVHKFDSNAFTERLSSLAALVLPLTERKRRNSTAMARILAGEWPALGAGWLPEPLLGGQLRTNEAAVGRRDGRMDWEIGRFHVAVWLSRRFRDTGDAAYATAFESFLDGWFQHYGEPGGDQWRVPMEVAIRAMNLSLALGLYVQGAESSSTWLEEMHERLWTHGRYVAQRLEFEMPRSGNHLLADLAALVYLGLVLEPGPESRAWYEWGLRGLLRELFEQIEADGSQREGSPAYHAQVCEMLVYPMSLAAAHGWRPDADTRTKLALALDYLSATLDEDGCPLAVGDDDGGHIHDPYGPHESAALHRDARPILRLGQQWIGIDLDVNEIGAPEGLTQFSQAGLSILKVRKLYLACVTGTPRPDGLWTHRHNDLLSFELRVAGQPVVVDSGCGAYQPASLRDAFRSTRAHATLLIDDREQHALSSDPFAIPGYRGARVQRAERVGDEYRLVAEHNSYRRLPGAPRHRREWRVAGNGRRLRITDEVEGRGEHELQWCFPLATGVADVDLGDSRAELGVSGIRICIDWDHQQLKVNVGEGPFSRFFGCVQKTRVLQARLRAILPARVIWTFTMVGEEGHECV